MLYGRNCNYGASGELGVYRSSNLAIIGDDSNCHQVSEIPDCKEDCEEGTPSVDRMTEEATLPTVTENSGCHPQMAELLEEVLALEAICYNAIEELGNHKRALLEMSVRLDCMLAEYDE